MCSSHCRHCCALFLLQLLQPYVDALTELDYNAALLDLGADEMDAVVDKRAESDHKLDMKQLPVEKQTPLDKSKLPKATPGQDYYRGWIVGGLPTTKKMLQAGLLIKVIVSDFAAAKKTAKGSYAFAVGFDANGHIVPFAGMHTIKPESKPTWLEFVEAMKVRECVCACVCVFARMFACVCSRSDRDLYTPTLHTSGLLWGPHRRSRRRAHFRRGQGRRGRL